MNKAYSTFLCKACPEELTSHMTNEGAQEGRNTKVAKGKDAADGKALFIVKCRIVCNPQSVLVFEGVFDLKLMPPDSHNSFTVLFYTIPSSSKVLGSGISCSFYFSELVL